MLVNKYAVIILTVLIQLEERRKKTVKFAKC